MRCQHTLQQYTRKKKTIYHLYYVFNVFYSLYSNKCFGRSNLTNKNPVVSTIRSAYYGLFYLTGTFFFLLPSY